jgi:hypothetical protein
MKVANCTYVRSELTLSEHTRAACSSMYALCDQMELWRSWKWKQQYRRTVLEGTSGMLRSLQFLNNNTAGFSRRLDNSSEVECVQLENTIDRGQVRQQQRWFFYGNRLVYDDLYDCYCSTDRNRPAEVELTSFASIAQETDGSNQSYKRPLISKASLATTTCISILYDTFWDWGNWPTCKHLHCNVRPSAKQLISALKLWQGRE